MLLEPAVLATMELWLPFFSFPPFFLGGEEGFESRYCLIFS